MPASPASLPGLQEAGPQDAPFLELLFRQVRAPEFASLALPAAVIEQLVLMQFRAQTTGYKRQFPHAVDSLILLDGEAVGRLLVERNSSEIRVVDIALLETARGRGFGTYLLERLAREADAASTPLRLNVRLDNPALRLYERLGFIRTGGDGLNLTMERRGLGRAAPDHSMPVPAQYTGVETDRVLGPEPSLQYCRSLLGQSLRVCSEDGIQTHLKVHAAEPLPLAPAGTDSFVLRLTGPLDAVLPSAYVQLFTNRGSMSIFIVPTGPSDGEMHYEAIFNRM